MAKYYTTKKGIILLTGIALFLFNSCSKKIKESESIENPGINKVANQSAILEMDTVMSKVEAVKEPLVGDLSDYIVEQPMTSINFEEVSSPKLIATGISEDQIQLLEKEFGEENFAVVVDDRSYYSYTFESALDSLGIPLIHVKGEVRFLKLVGLEKTYWLDLKKDGKKQLYWSYVMFNTKEAPRLIEDILGADLKEIKDDLLVN